MNHVHGADNAAYFFKLPHPYSKPIKNKNRSNMERYRNEEGNSGVRAFEAGKDYVLIQFVTGEIYLYTNNVTGPKNINAMKRLAKAGRGLSTFISQHVKDKYAR